MNPEAGRLRSFFPRGLQQPAGSYRFGVDALLLAACGAAARAGAAAPFRFADLGTGCGAAGLGFALLSPAACGVGLEKQPELAAAADHNARQLGLNRRFAAIRGDAADPGSLQTLMHWGKCDVVLSNPPWRVEGTGRLPAGALRRAALFGGPGTLEIFARAAALLLAKGGRCCAAIGAFRLRDQLDALDRAGLSPCRVREVRSLPDRAPWLYLIEATGEPAARCARVGLTLCERPGVPTEQSLAFCPFLGTRA